jgi:hypothetical protein
LFPDAEESRKKKILTVLFSFHILSKRIFCKFYQICFGAIY